MIRHQGLHQLVNESAEFAICVHLVRSSPRSGLPTRLQNLLTEFEGIHQLIEGVSKSFRRQFCV